MAKGNTYALEVSAFFNAAYLYQVLGSSCASSLPQPLKLMVQKTSCSLLLGGAYGSRSPAPKPQEIHESHSRLPETVSCQFSLRRTRLAGSISQRISSTQ